MYRGDKKVPRVQIARVQKAISNRFVYQATKIYIVLRKW